MNEKTAGSSGSSDTKDQDDMQEFLEMLKTQFKGSRCYLGQYESPNFMPQGGWAFLSFASLGYSSK